MIRVESVRVLPGVTAILFAIVAGFLTSRIITAIMKKRTNIERYGEERNYYYVVTSTWAKCGGKECEVKREDRFKVLAKYKDALLIEILGDDNKPYLVEESFTEKVSNYPKVR